MKKVDKIFNLFFIIFSVVGMIFVVAGIIWMVSSNRFKQDAVEIRAVISEIDSYRDADGERHHRVYVTYAYGGETFESVRLSEYSSSMYEGKEITLFLNPEKPQNVSTGSTVGGIVFITMGAIFVLVGIIPLLVMTKKNSRKKKIIAAGYSIYATVESIGYNTSYSVNGQHPYVIYCTYRDDYKDIIYRFKSDNLWTNPEYIIQPGSEIRIFVNKDDYSKYHVDTESALQGKIVDYT